MPALPPANGVARARLNATLNGVPAGNRIYFGVSGTYPFSNAQCAALAGEIYSNWTAQMAGYALPNYEFLDVVVEDLSTGSSAVGASTGSSVPGGRSGVELANNAAVVLNLEIPARYRGGHPRVMLPPLAVGDMVTSNAWNTGVLAGVASAWGTFIGDVVGSSAAIAMGVTLECVVSYRHANAPRITPVVYPVTTYVPRAKIGTMKRRL